jgi:hypothetical protein
MGRRTREVLSVEVSQMNCGCRPWGWHKAEQGKDHKVSEARRLRNYDVYMRGYHDGRTSVLDLLREVSKQGVESDLKGIDYLTVQIDRELWNAIQKEIEQ